LTGYTEGLTMVSAVEEAGATLSIRLMKYSLQMRKNTTCKPIITPKTTACFALMPSMCFRMLTTKNKEELTRA